MSYWLAMVELFSRLLGAITRGRFVSQDDDRAAADPVTAPASSADRTRHAPPCHDYVPDMLPVLPVRQPNRYVDRECPDWILAQDTCTTHPALSYHRRRSPSPRGPGWR